MTAGSQTVVNSVRPLKIGEKIREKLGENQEFFLFFLFWGPKIDFNPPFTKKKLKKNFANDMNITKLPHPIQMALAQKINLIKI